MAAGLSTHGKTVQVKPGLTNAQEITCLSETNEDGLAAVKCELGLLAHYVGQGRPRLCLGGHTARGEFGERASNPHRNDPSITLRQLIDCWNQMRTLSARGNGSRFCRCEFDRLHKWGEFFARDRLRDSGGGHSIADSADHDELAIEIAKCAKANRVPGRCIMNWG